ncbi:hypothetical protein H5410_005767 [Solanum commersonii]|uniref:Uncharacterized protein n=1 Tax=Solanum commersonii TaxID=4109 RepID=A0A9J6A7J3_SOLCO|nr:hypothetical protein H5410_005767 [Solanum commersonii]
MINNVINIIKGWNLKFLSTGGRDTLIRHVLEALNIHTLVVVHPPKGTIKIIEKSISRFFGQKMMKVENSTGSLRRICAFYTMRELEGCVRVERPWMTLFGGGHAKGPLAYGLTIGPPKDHFTFSWRIS